jgi:hypothetical protein
LLSIGDDIDKKPPDSPELLLKGDSERDKMDYRNKMDDGLDPSVKSKIVSVYKPEWRDKVNQYSIVLNLARHQMTAQYLRVGLPLAVYM